MAIQIELQEQYNRFCNEIDAIKSQIDFIEESFILSGIKEKGNKFTRCVLPKYKTIDDVHKNLDKLKKIIFENKSKLLTMLGENSYKEIPEKFIGIDYRSEEGELLQYILDIIDSGQSNPNKILEEITTELEALCIINGENIGGEFYLELYSNKDKLLEYIDLSLKISHNQEISGSEENVKLLEHYIRLLNLIDVRKSTNIYRQAFIQTIAIFDTITFECFRIKFNANFFDYLNYFKDGNIKYSEIAGYKSFDVFREETIEQKLKSCYLKDLLNVIKTKDKDYYIFNSQDFYSYYREMINRRNCHIHNNGIADKNYFGLDNTPQGSFNIYHFKIDDYLLIDKSYLYQSIKMCDSFLSKFTN